MTIYWTSDTHFGHKRIAEFEPGRMTLGDTLEARDAEMVKRWNDTVTNDDVVWVLGDVAMGDINYSLGLVSQLNGTKFLVAGNHDRCWSHNKPGYAAKWRSRYQEAGLIIDSEHFQTTIDGIPVNVCHFPYEGDSHDADRYKDARIPKSRVPVIHGHVHSAWKIKGNQFNVGVDMNDYRPVPQEEIAQWLKTL